MNPIDIDEYELEISSDCNAQCPLCQRTHLKMPLRGNNNISLDDLKSIFYKDEYIAGKRFKLCGVLGDPILNPECIEICDFLSSKGARRIVLSTNGGMNTADWWTKLAKIPNVRVDFSVDGYENTNHIYRVNVNWKTLVRNMKAYTDAEGIGTWVFIPFAHNEDDYEKAKTLAKELGLSFVKRTSGRNEISKKKRHQPRKGSAVDLGNSKKLPHKDLQLVHKTIQAHKDKDIDFLDKIADTVKCKHLNTPEAFIGADLTLWPCCFLYDENTKPNSGVIPESINRDFNSLKKYKLEDILSTEFYSTLTQRWKGSNPTHLFRCIKSCGNNAVYLNNKTEVN